MAIFSHYANDDLRRRITELDSFLGRLAADYGQQDHTKDLIFHYTSIDTFKKMVAGERIRFTEFSHLNDTSELSYGMNIAWQEYTKLTMSNSQIFEIKGLIDERRKVLDDIAFFVACFSRMDDDLSQWRGYGDDGKGLALGFDAKIVPEREDPSRIGLLEFRDVQYEPAAIIEMIQSGVSSVLDVLPYCPREEGDERMFFMTDLAVLIVKYFLSIAVLFKHPAYKCEEEIRLVLIAKRDRLSDVNGYQTRPSGTGEVHFIDKPILGSLMKGLKLVRVGPAASSEAFEDIKALVQCHPHIKIEKSNIPYRSVK